MRRVLTFSAVVMICLLLLGTASLADTRASRRVEVTCDPLVAPNFERCDLGEKLTVVSLCTQSIEVSFNGGDATTLTTGDSIQYDCTDNIYDCYDVTVITKSGDRETATGCAGTGGDEIPTLSEWGLIIFSLLILTMVTVVVARRRTSLTAAGADSGVSSTMGGPLFVPYLFRKALIITLSLAIVILVAAFAIAGQVALRDIAGTIISAGIVAYMAHLWFASSKRK